MYSNVDEILSYALNNRSEIKLAKKNIESAELNKEISKSGFYPSLSFSYGLNAGANFSNFSFFQQINDNRGFGQSKVFSHQSLRQIIRFRSNISKR